MKKQLVTTILVALFPILFTACVSSMLQGSPPTFSKDVRLINPASPFVATKNSVFPSWKSSRTGNVITIISECDPNSSASLSVLHRMVEEPLSGIQILKEENVTFQNKPAVFKAVKAELDGQAIELQSLSFRRKSCGYVSTLSGKPGNLQQDENEFSRFNAGLQFE
ncbi:MAG: hypothetical protein K0R29_1833 [Pseudobdellovibrio sp.]|jgi:hypothetical protein|nr:hypothetical protein [Pseudobdellovibrio sp.]